MTATATLERGRPFHATEGDVRNAYTLAQDVGPFFTMVIQGPIAPAELDCTLFQVREDAAHHARRRRRGST